MMIQKYVDQFMKNKKMVEDALINAEGLSYQDIVTAVIKAIAHEYEPDAQPHPDPERVHEIDDGDYQGTLVYVIADHGYQPSHYWYVKISYGSCSVCDTLQRIDSDFDFGTKERSMGLMTLALHVVQGLKEMGESDEI